MFCGQWSTCKYDGDALRASRLYCRSWNCDECLPRRLRDLRRLAAAGHPTTLITLTVSPKAYATPEQAACRLTEAWRLTRQRAKREGLADRIEYLAIFEETKRGWPHLHILARCPYLPQRWLSQCMHDYADSPIVDIRRVYNRRHASRYVAKYVSKGPGRFRGTKRYFRSKAYGDDGRTPQPVADASKPGWATETDLYILQHVAVQYGWRVVESSDNWWRAEPLDSAIWIGPRDPPHDRWPTMGRWWLN